MVMKKLLIFASLLCLLAGCKSRPAENASVRSVKADTARLYGQAGSATFPGKVVAASDINIAFRVSGPILSASADVGSHVRKGQVLARIDPRDFEVQLAATEAEYNRIKKESERIAALYEKGTVTPSEYEGAMYGLRQITAKFDAHKNALKDTELLAPCDGYIQKRLFHPGETVSAGMPVVSMIGTGSGEVEINIPSSDFIRREDFDSYYCTVDIYPGKTFPLELVGITRKANMNQLYTMRFRLAANGGQIPGPGMSVMVTILYKTESARAVSLPVTALFESGGGSAVWVYDPADSTVSSRQVQLSQILAGGTAVISSGLSAGEIVLSAGVNSVEQGEKVKLLPPVSPTNAGGML